LRKIPHPAIHERASRSKLRAFSSVKRLAGPGGLARRGGGMVKLGYLLPAVVAGLFALPAAVSVKHPHHHTSTYSNAPIDAL
jgi:hypothetical protein